MAGRNGKENEFDNGKVIDTAGERELKTTKNPRTRTTADRGNGAGAGTGAGAGAGSNNSGATEKEKSSGVALVNAEKPTETIPAPQEVKKAKRPRKKKVVKKNDEAFNAEQITALLLTVSNMASMTERGKIFALSELEAKQLAEPLSKIIANNDSMKAIAEHSDSVALAMTAFMIFAPKFFMWVQYEKAHKKIKGIEVKTAKGVKPIERKTNGSDRGNETANANANATDALDINSVIPSII